MAIATKEFDVKVKLELSSAEAKTLFSVLSQVSGCPHKSCRKYVSSILKALDHIGIVGASYGLYDSRDITFQDGSELHIEEIIKIYG